MRINALCDKHIENKTLDENHEEDLFENEKHLPFSTKLLEYWAKFMIFC